jgi:hypothetical protein
VFMLRRRENPGWFTGQENCRVGPFAVVHASDQKHAVIKARRSRMANAVALGDVTDRLP